MEDWGSSVQDKCYAGMQSAYLKHRVGLVLFVAELGLISVILFENEMLRETIAANLYLYFWAGSALLMPMPLAGAFSLQGTLRFYAYSFPFFLLSGLIALVLPDQLMFRIVSILAIGWIVSLVILKRRRPKAFDLSVGSDPSMFIESLLLLVLSVLCSYAVVFAFGLLITQTFSTFTNYIFFMTILYSILSAAVAFLRPYKRNFGERQTKQCQVAETAAEPGTKVVLGMWFLESS